MPEIGLQRPRVLALVGREGVHRKALALSRPFIERTSVFSFQLSPKLVAEGIALALLVGPRGRRERTVSLFVMETASMASIWFFAPML